MDVTHCVQEHGLWTPNEGIHQRYLKNWPDVADKICFGRTIKFKIGIEFSAVQRRLFSLCVSVVLVQELELLLIDLAEWVKGDREREGVSQQKKQKRCHNYDPFLYLMKIQNDTFLHDWTTHFVEHLCAHECRHITTRPNSLQFSLIEV